MTGCISKHLSNIIVIVAPANFLCMSSLGGTTGGRWCDWAGAMRPGNCHYIRDESRGRLSAAPVDMVAGSRGHVVQGELAGAEGVAPKSRRAGEWGV